MKKWSVVRVVRTGNCCYVKGTLRFVGFERGLSC